MFKSIKRLIVDYDDELEEDSYIYLVEDSLFTVRLPVPNLNGHEVESFATIFELYSHIYGNENTIISNLVEYYLWNKNKCGQNKKQLLDYICADKDDMKAFYAHIKYEQYYKCLLNQIDKLTWLGKIKDKSI